MVTENALDFPQFVELNLAYSNCFTWEELLDLGPHFTPRSSTESPATAKSTAATLSNGGIRATRAKKVRVRRVPGNSVRTASTAKVYAFYKSVFQIRISTSTGALRRDALKPHVCVSELASDSDVPAEL